jgi:hypothetical protein
VIAARKKVNYQHKGLIARKKVNYQHKGLIARSGDGEGLSVVRCW